MLVSGRLETGSSLARLVKRIGEIRSRIGPVDAVLVSGDISDDGSTESYRHFRALSAPLDLPLFVVPGNHDAREAMRSAFLEDGYFSKTGKLNWHRKAGTIHLIGLDTLIEGEGGGALDGSTLAFLTDALSRVGAGPVLLAMHHPPFRTGIGFMDEIGLVNSAELAELLSDFNGELRIVCGHIHSMMVVSMGSHIAISAPSPCSTFALDTRPDAPVGFMDMEDGCLLHIWENGFRSIRIGPVAGDGPFPF